MTSNEIKQKQALELSDTRWLQEIAFQLALLNEKPEPQKHPQKGK